MIGAYLILVIIISLSLFLSRDRRLSYFLVWSFVIVQWALTIYVYNQKGETELIYFTADSLGIIFLVILSIV